MPCPTCKTRDNHIVAIVRAIGNLPNTFWGILILGSSMYIAVKFNLNIGYYFAGIGSTLTGINHINNPGTNTTTTIGSQPPVRVESNASDSTS